jgi:hypothetical protein
MTDAPNGYQIYAPRNEDPYEDLCKLAEAVAKTGELLDHDGRLYWLREGKRIMVTLDVLREFIEGHIVTPYLKTPGPLTNQMSKLRIYGSRRPRAGAQTAHRE